MVRAWRYGKNYKARAVEIQDITLYFSYNTVVAFMTPEEGLVVCENVWSNTTGRHLNRIDYGDHRNRIPRQEFLEKLEAVVQRFATHDMVRLIA